jgi:tetratricopeptide (TPR) repeat protein
MEQADRDKKSGLVRLLRAMDGPVPLLGIILLTAALAVGGVHGTMQIALAGMALAAFVMLTVRMHIRRSRMRFSLFGMGLAVAVVWTLLQWLPLPADLVGLLNPSALEAHNQASGLVGQSSADWLPASLDPSRTALSWLTLTGFLLTFLVAVNLREYREQRKILPILVQWTGLTVLLISVVQALVGATRIFGVYRASVDTSHQVFLTTFVNPNHAAALLVLSATASFGLWLSSEEDGLRKWFHFVATGLLTMGVIATGSRAGFPLLVAALLTISVVAYVVQTDQEKRQSLVKGLIGGACVAAIGWFLMATSGWTEQLIGLDWAALQEDVAQRWKVGMAVTEAYPVMGTGHGAFAMASSSAMDNWGGGYITYAHNLFLQAFADWGVVPTIVIFVAMFWAMLGVLRASRNRMDVVAVWVGLFAILIQNLVEFSFWIPGVGYAVMVGAGWVVGESMRQVEGHEHKRHLWARMRFRWPHAMTVVLVALMALTGYHAWAQNPHRWQHRVRAALAQDKPSRVSIPVMLVEHPSDHHIHLLASHLAYHSNRKALARDIGKRMLVLAPNSLPALRHRASMELKEKNAAAALPFLMRLANQGDAGRQMAVSMVLSERKLKGLPEGFFGQNETWSMEAIHYLRRKGQHRAVEHMLGWARSAFPESLVIQEQLIEIWRHRKDRHKALDQLATRMLVSSTTVSDPGKAQQLKRLAYMAQGHLLKAAGRNREAWHLFHEAALLDPTRSSSPLLQAGNTLGALGETEKLRRLLVQLDETLADDPLLQGQKFHLRSVLAEKEGNLRLAINEMQRAVLYLKGHPTYYTRLASLYDRHGDERSATEIRKKLAALIKSKGGNP